MTWKTSHATGNSNSAKKCVWGQEKTGRGCPSPTAIGDISTVTLLRDFFPSFFELNWKRVSWVLIVGVVQPNAQLCLRAKS
jgi:hypothetical protein